MEDTFPEIDETRPEDRQEADKARDVRWTRQFVFFFSVLGMVGLLAYAFSCWFPASWPKTQEVVSTFGAGLLLAWASFLVGALLGFVFGIPRALAKTASEREDSQSRRNSLAYNPNTNLEQISDWLTKIIVGVGLIQLTKVPNYAVRLASYFSISSIPGKTVESATLSLIILFVVCGFLAGYLTTRLYVTGALRRAETEKEPVVGGLDELTIDEKAPDHVEPAV